jgi:hypothetical protein
VPLGFGGGGVNITKSGMSFLSLDQAWPKVRFRRVVTSFRPAGPMHTVPASPRQFSAVQCLIWRVFDV